MSKCQFWLLVVSCVSFSSFGQQLLEISGVVRSGSDAIENASIFAGGNRYKTDANGSFSFSVSTEVKEFTVVAPHFEKITQQLSDSRTQFYSFNLSPHAEDLSEVIVKQKTQTIYDVSGANKINTNALREFSAQSVGDALREVTGVNSLKTGNNIVKPIIHGLGGSRIAMLQNRFRLEDQQWGSEHAPSVDVNGLTRISIVKDAAALQYSGDGVGGLVLMERSIPVKDTIYGQITSTAMSNGSGGALAATYVHAREKQTSYRFDAAGKYFGDRRSADYVLSNTGNRDFSFSAQANRQTKFGKIETGLSFFQTETGILAAAHIGNATDLYNAIKSQQPAIIRPFTHQIKNPRQEVSHILAYVSLERDFGQWNSKWYYGFQSNNRKEYDIRIGGRNNIPALDLQLNSHMLLVDFKRKFGTTELKTGFSGSFQSNFANPETGVRPLVPNFTKSELGFYGIIDTELSDKLRFESGIRYDFTRITASKFYQTSRWRNQNYETDFGQFIVFENAGQLLVEPIFNYHNIAANAKISAQLTSSYRIDFGITALNRNPNVAELFSDGLHHSTGVIEVGDLRLKQENSIKASVNQFFNFGRSTFYLESFAQRINNFIFLQPTGFETTIRGAFPVYEYKRTDARLFGTDFTWNCSITEAISFKTALAYVSGFDIENRKNLIDIPPLNWRTVVVLKPSRKSDFTLEFRHEFADFQRAFPDYDFQTTIVENGELVQVTVPISRPPAAYHLFDFKASLPFKIQKTAFNASFGVQNITNELYRNYLNRQRLFADELGRNFNIQLQINI